MNRRIDFHCHVLPGADHGSDSLACSLSQMKKAAAAGIDVIVATPTFPGLS
jgi:protein-tyrosine phosphatase